MVIDLWSTPPPFAPAPFTRSLECELLRAIENGSAALNEYNQWREAQKLPLSEEPHILLCFIAAHAQPEVRELVLSWLELVNSREPPN